MRRTYGVTITGDHQRGDSPTFLFDDELGDPFLGGLSPAILDDDDELRSLILKVGRARTTAQEERERIEFLLSILRDDLPEENWGVLVEMLEAIVDRHEDVLVGVVREVLAAWAKAPNGGLIGPDAEFDR